MKIHKTKIPQGFLNLVPISAKGGMLCLLFFIPMRQILPSLRADTVSQ